MWLVPQRPRVIARSAPETLPPPKPEEAEVPAAHGEKAPAPRYMPISLDTVLHLAGSQNLHVGQARAKVDEADAKVDLAHKKCFPLKKHASNVVMAEQDYWKQKAELSKLTADTVLEAATTYIDLVTARTGRIGCRGLASPIWKTC